MNKNLFWCGVIALILAAVFSAAGQSPQVAAAIEKIPSSARTTKDFAPRGLVIDNEATGDLNGDNISDAALTLTAPLEELEGQNEIEGIDARGGIGHVAHDEVQVRMLPADASGCDGGG